MKTLISVTLITGLCVALAGCSNDNKDPKQGPVSITETIYKVCDGTTLIYVKSPNGLDAITNSPECVK